MSNLKIHYTHKKRIKDLFRERYSLQEIFIMYNKLIPYARLRTIVRGVKRQDRI